MRDELIAAHRVYWGWLGVGMLLRGEHGQQPADGLPGTDPDLFGLRHGRSLG